MADEGWGGSGGGGQEQDFAMDGGEFTKDDLASGDTIDKEGWYHLEIVGVKNEFDTLNDKGKEKSPCVVLTMNVLESVKGQCPAGSKYFHRLYVASKGGGAAAEGSVKSALRFGLGIGLLTEVEKDGRPVIVDMQTGSTRIPASIWQRALNKQLVAKIVKEKNDDPKFPDKYAIPFGRAYHPLDDAVADVAKNKEALAMLGGTAPPKSPAKSDTAKAETPPKSNAAAGKPAEDDFSDL